MRQRLLRRDEDGSIIITFLVIMVATGLVVALIVRTDSGLRQSARAGDSANALQLADAGVNEAVRRASTEPATVSTFTETRSIAGVGTYVFSAVRDTAQPSVWHVSSRGKDTAGAERRIRADAVPDSFFANALFGQTALGLASGVSVDSFLDATARCTGKGLVGTNNAAGFTQGGNGNGVGVVNCQHAPTGDGSGYAYDGCISYANSDPADIPPAANCPPSKTLKMTPAFSLPYVQPSSATFVAQPAGTCNTGTGQVIAAGTYHWTSFKMLPGCTTVGPVVIYVSGAVRLGANGSNHKLNAPTLCVNPPDDSGCWTSGHAQNLQIYAVTGSTGELCYEGNGTTFWGTIVAPSRTFSKCGGGGSHISVWGAMIFNAVDTSAQFALHFDESLANLSSGKYVIRNWRESSS